MSVINKFFRVNILKNSFVMKPVFYKHGKKEVDYFLHGNFCPKLNIFNKSFKCYTTRFPISRIADKKKFHFLNFLSGTLSGCCFSKKLDDESDVEPILVSTDHLSGTEDVNRSNLKAEIKNVNQTIEENTILEDDFLPTFDNYFKNYYQTNAEKSDSETEIPTIQKSKKQKLNFQAKTDDYNEVKNKERKPQKKKKKMGGKIMPNYFVAFQVSNPKIHENLIQVQKHILEQDKRLSPAIISTSTAHITLMVMRLDNEEEHSKALDILKVIHEELNKNMLNSPLKLQFKGIGHFRNTVVFAKLNEDDGLSRLHNYAKIINQHFNDASIKSTDRPDRNFNPHLTLLKLSASPKLFRQGIRKINPTIYETHKDMVFGDQIVTSIQLLKMHGPKNDKGYYTGDEFTFDIPEIECA